jgi:Protein of unknown function (DUF3592)
MLSVIVAFIVLLALIFSAVLIFKARRKRQASEWPAVRGRVIQSRLYWSTDADGNPAQEVALTFEYIVDGQTLRCSRVKSWFNRQPHQVVKKFRVGAAVQVIYNPEKPTEAVLK